MVLKELINNYYQLIEVSRFCKDFENKSSTSINFSKTQLSKIEMIFLNQKKDTPVPFF